MQKYRMLQQYRTLPNQGVVTRIQAIRNFGPVRAGTLGGYIESTENLSHKGNCWVADNAIVAGDARVRDDALVRDSAILENKAAAVDRAVICHFARLDGSVLVCGCSTIGHYSCLTDAVNVRDHAIVLCEPRQGGLHQPVFPHLRDKVVVRDYARILGRVSLSGNVLVEDYALIRHSASLQDDVRVGGFSIVGGRTRLRENAWVLRHAEVSGMAFMNDRSVATGHGLVTGRSQLLCQSSVGGNAQVRDERLSGNEHRSGRE